MDAHVYAPPKSLGKAIDNLFDAMALVDACESLMSENDESLNSVNAARVLKMARELIKTVIEGIDEIDTRSDWLSSRDEPLSAIAEGDECGDEIDGLHATKVTREGKVIPIASHASGATFRA